MLLIVKKCCLICYRRVNEWVKMEGEEKGKRVERETERRSWAIDEFLSLTTLHLAAPGRLDTRHVWTSFQLTSSSPLPPIIGHMCHQLPAAPTAAAAAVAGSPEKGDHCFDKVIVWGALVWRVRYTNTFGVWRFSATWLRKIFDSNPNKKINQKN